jgi:hypothetical protein
MFFLNLEKGSRGAFRRGSALVFQVFLLQTNRSKVRERLDINKVSMLLGQGSWHKFDRKFRLFDGDDILTSNDVILLPEVQDVSVM